MGSIECIGSLKAGMKTRKDMIVFAAECLAKMFEKGEEELVSQVWTRFSVSRCCTEL